MGTAMSIKIQEKLISSLLYKSTKKLYGLFYPNGKQLPGVSKFKVILKTWINLSFSLDSL